MNNNKKNRICIISKFLFENDTRLQQQVNTLVEQGKTVDVLCYYNSDESKVKSSGASTVYGIVKPSRKDTLVTYLLSTLKFSFFAFWKLQKLAFKSSYDVIVVHTLPELLVFIPILQKLSGTKILLDIRDTSVELFDSKLNGNRPILKKIVKLSAKFSCDFSDKIITASLGFEEKLIERKVPKEKISVLYNSADTNIFQYDTNRKFEKITSCVKIIYHGTIAERFGIDVAINAMSILKESIPNSTINIFGFYDEEYKTKIKELIKKLNLDKNVILNGRETLTNLYSHILNSDIGIVPYRSDGFMELALSTKMFEYIASGIPVVASRLRPAELVFDDGCVQYAAPSSPEEFAEGIKKMCLNPELRKTKVQKAFEVHSRIDSSMMAKKYLSIIEGLSN